MLFLYEWFPIKFWKKSTVFWRFYWAIQTNKTWIGKQGVGQLPENVNRYTRCRTAMTRFTTHFSAQSFLFVWLVGWFFSYVKSALLVNVIHKINTKIVSRKIIERYQKRFIEWFLQQQCVLPNTLTKLLNFA